MFNNLVLWQSFYDNRCQFSKVKEATKIEWAFNSWCKITPKIIPTICITSIFIIDFLKISIFLHLHLIKYRIVVRKNCKMYWVLNRTLPWNSIRELLDPLLITIPLFIKSAKLKLVHNLNIIIINAFLLTDQTSPV